MSKGDRWFRLTMRVLDIAEKLPWGQWAKSAKARRIERKKRREARREARKLRRGSR